jgi:hypothetical protein
MLMFLGCGWGLFGEMSLSDCHQSSQKLVSVPQLSYFPHRRLQSSTELPLSSSKTSLTNRFSNGYSANNSKLIESEGENVLLSIKNQPNCSSNKSFLCVFLLQSEISSENEGKRGGKVLSKVLY